jgi:malonyl-CoA/methylmalonyl-CoA synthetase
LKERHLRNVNLYSLMRRRFPADLDQACLLRSGSGDTVSYRTLDATSARIANMFARRGCKPGDRVAAQVEKSVSALAVYLACLRAGLVYLPLNTGYQPREVAYFLGDATPRVVLCGTASRGAITAIAPARATVDTLVAEDTG